MYFEVHLTTFPFPVEKRTLFEEACRDVKARFTIIELGQGLTKMQPMATYISFDPYVKVLEDIIRLNFHFHNKGFPISRSKIEYPSQYYPEAKSDPNLAFIYFESHIKVQYSPERHDELKSLGKSHNAHLSTNPLAKSLDQRFLTVRQYEEDYDMFNERVDTLIA